jgi:hypothetical protein
MYQEVRLLFGVIVHCHPLPLALPSSLSSWCLVPGMNHDVSDLHTMITCLRHLPLS